MKQVNPHAIIEASRNMARQSRDLMLPELKRAYRNTIPTIEVQKAFQADLETRMNLVMDCFNTGAATMLKLLHGDLMPEPWEEEYDHETRLREILKQYGLLEDETASRPGAPE
jgi:hypothetical protein